MRFRTIPAGVICLALLAGGSTAQTAGVADGPVETPPADFDGTQYVDSRGCVFVRAGYNGATAWVPRLTSEREALCGLDPTMPATEHAYAGAVTSPDLTASSLLPEQQLFTLPEPEVVNLPVSPAVVSAPVAARPANFVFSTRGTLTTACPSLSSKAQGWVKSHGLIVVCLPADALVADRRGDGSNVIHVPKPFPLRPPAGWEFAFEDDRLNPYRGHRTYEGLMAMRGIWTTDIPRELRMGGGSNYRVVAATRASDGTYVLATKGIEPATPVTAPVTVASAKRYVRVGLFSTESAARKAASHLKGLGLPLRLATVSKSSGDYRVLLAGPFGSTEELQSGLSAVQDAGYTKATARD